MFSFFYAEKGCGLLVGADNVFGNGTGLFITENMCLQKILDMV